MASKKIHLIANAHIDPVWLWTWEEGAAEALATFRQAADFCREFDGFIFCHNEAVLYQWIQEFEPALFRRIRRLVKGKKWHVMGGWYVQPDCNMPAGESLVRQILLGKRWFRKEFGVNVTAAANLDSFGHSRGLVQVLAKSGYDAYLFCRPVTPSHGLPGHQFLWTGFDGSTVMACLAAAHYNSPCGGARAKAEDWMQKHPDHKLDLLPWGVGNHGGGPSRIDLEALDHLINETADVVIRHSTPEAFFRDLKKTSPDLPRYDHDLNPWAVGCYTSMSRVKRKHRRLENELFLTEKTAAAAAFQNLMAYPEAEFREAQRDLAFSQFHDILPGSCMPEAEEASLRRMDHGLEILSRINMRAFVALTAGQAPARNGEIPVFVYNPHPFRVNALVECEIQPHEPNTGGGFLTARVRRNGLRLPAQTEKEASNLNVEWRKKIVFEADLEPAAMNRFDCRLERIDTKPASALKAMDGFFSFKTGEIETAVNARTGLIDRFKVRGTDILAENAFQPLVMFDNADSWSMTSSHFRNIKGAFSLAAPEEGRRASGITDPAASSVRVIEDGEVRTVIESVLAYNGSHLFMRYKLPKSGTEIEVEIRVHWREKDRMLKLSLPTAFLSSRAVGQTVFGVQKLMTDGSETTAQKWTAVIADKEGWAFTCINDGVYGLDVKDNEMRISLLRSPAYSCDPFADPLVVQDRYAPRIDQGEHVFRFWINAGHSEERLGAIEREALARNETPVIHSFFPSGSGRKIRPFVRINGGSIVITALKKGEDGRDLLIRLFEPTGRKRTAVLTLPAFSKEIRLRFDPFEIKTLLFNPRTRRFLETDLLERPVRKRRKKRG